MALGGVNSSSPTTPSNFSNTTSSSDPIVASTDGYVTGTAAVESCNMEWADFENSYLDFEDSLLWAAGSILYTVSGAITSTIYSTYKLCDGVPRAVLTGNTSYSLVTVTSPQWTPPLVYTYESIILPSPVILTVITTTVTITIPLPVSEVGFSPYSVLPPICKVGASDCASLYIASSNAMFTGGGGINATASPPLYACGTAFDNYTESLPCYIGVPTIPLI